MKPTILTCAVTGTFPTREHNPNLPVTPAEIADACIGAAKAGAAICHIHVREPDTGRPSMNIEYYREVIREDDPTKPAPGTLFKAPEIRTEHIVELKPEICTLDLNTMWFGGGAVINTPRNLRIMAGRMYAAGVKPEIEVFDTGDLVMAQDLVADGTIKLPALFQIVTGIKYGMPSTPESMLLAKSLLPKNSEWAAFGAGRYAFPMLAQAFILGGHCRIGMEDTVHLAKGTPAPSNAALVERAVRIIRELGGQIATVGEARSLLALPARS